MRGAVVEYRGDVVAVIGEAADLGVETIFGVITRVLEQNARELAAQDLQFGRRTADTGTIHWERGGGRTVVPDETHTHFGGVGGTDVVLDAHPADDLTRRAAHVDVVALVAALWEPLDDRGLPAARSELMREGGTGDAGTGDQRTRLAHPRCVSPIAASETPQR